MASFRNMYFAGASRFGSDFKKPPPVIVAEEVFPKGQIKTPCHQTKSRVVLEEQFAKEKTQLQLSLDRKENRQTSEYMALFDRRRTNAARLVGSEKDVADRAVALRLDEVMQRGRENIAIFGKFMGELRKHFEEVCLILEKECVDDFLRSARWRRANSKRTEEKADEAKVEIRACLDEMQRQVAGFILDEPGRSLREVYNFTMEKYEEFEAKVAELKDGIQNRTEDETEKTERMKRIEKRMKIEWWDWIINIGDMLLIT